MSTCGRRAEDTGTPGPPSGSARTAPAAQLTAAEQDRGRRPGGGRRRRAPRPGPSPRTTPRASPRRAPRRRATSATARPTVTRSPSARRRTSAGTAADQHRRTDQGRAETRAVADEEGPTGRRRRRRTPRASSWTPRAAPSCQKARHGVVERTRLAREGGRGRDGCRPNVGSAGRAGSAAARATRRAAAWRPPGGAGGERGGGVGAGVGRCGRRAVRVVHDLTLGTARAASGR